MQSLGSESMFIFHRGCHATPTLHKGKPRSWEHQGVFQTFMENRIMEKNDAWILTCLCANTNVSFSPLTSALIGTQSSSMARVTSILEILSQIPTKRSWTPAPWTACGLLPCTAVLAGWWCPTFVMKSSFGFTICQVRSRNSFEQERKASVSRNGHYTQEMQGRQSLSCEFRYRDSVLVLLQLVMGNSFCALVSLSVKTELQRIILEVSFNSNNKLNLKEIKAN